MTPENKFTYASSIDNSLIYSEWGGPELFFLPMKGLCKK